MIPNPFHYGSQNDRLLKALEQGPITTIQIVRELFIYNHTRRISDLRQHGFIVTAKPLSNRGLWEYRLLTSPTASLRPGAVAGQSQPGAVET